MDVSKDELKAILATDQIAFTEQCFSTVSPGVDYMDNWHIHCIIEHLQAVERGEISRLIINMPPRCMKSITVSIAWPAWLLGRKPETQIIAASFGQSLSSKLSVDTRLIIESEWYKETFPEAIIAADQNEKAKFQTTKRGHRIATSVGGTITGEGGDYLILDDPIKPDEAPSLTVRQSTNSWISQTFLSRFNDRRKGKAVLVMQRLHENDPTAYLSENSDWHKLILPGYFDKHTLIFLGNKSWELQEGDYLHEARMGEKELEEALSDLGMYGFSGQILQRPSPDGGGEFKVSWLQFYDNYSKTFTAKGMNIYILYDPANQKKKKNDYTAIVVVGLANDNNYYILDLLRDRLNPTERIEKLMVLHRKWNKKGGKPPKVVCEQYGMMTDSFYLKRRQEEDNYRFKVIEVGGSMKKEDRIRKLIPIFESERLMLPRKILYDTVEGKSVELVKAFIDEELSVFPVGKHDDIIDALARILDEGVNATFPKEDVLYLESGQSKQDYLLGTYREDDFLTW